jgi:hypothetical protein
VPAAGLCVLVIDPEGVQLSVATALDATLGTGALHVLGSAAALEGGGQTTFGGVVSLTVKVVVQLLLLPAPSVAVTVTVCGPNPTKVPAAGLCVLAIGPQLSVAVALAA